MMHRIFVPVGQGAFYLEKFEIGEEKFNMYMIVVQALKL